VTVRQGSRDGSKDRTPSGAPVAVDFIERKRLSTPEPDSRPHTEDTDELEATRLLDRITGGAPPPTCQPGGDEPDEFFDELQATALQEHEVDDSEDLDPWIARQAQPGPAIASVKQAPPNGTAALESDVPTLRAAKQSAPWRRLHAPTIPRPRAPKISRPHAPRMPRLGGKGVRLTAAIVIGVLAIAVLGAIVKPGAHANTAQTLSTPAVSPPATFGLSGLNTTARGAEATLARITKAAARRSQRPARAHKPARKHQAPKPSHTSSSTAAASSRSVGVIHSAPAAPTYTPSASAASTGSGAQSASSDPAPTHSAPTAGPSGSSAILGPGHCGC
jgi:hypothetical protein